MNKFNDKNDVRQAVSDNMPDDLSVYGMDTDELLEYATENYIAYLKDQGFVYGKTDIEEIPVSDDVWWSFFE